MATIIILRQGSDNGQSEWLVSHHHNGPKANRSKTRGGWWDWGHSWSSTYQADPPDTGVDSGALRRLSRPLPEKEVEFVIIALSTVRDELGVDEGRVCRRIGGSWAYPLLDPFPSRTDRQKHPLPSSGQKVPQLPCPNTSFCASQVLLKFGGQPLMAIVA